ncbi:helix-turn-helix transcriptional regulator [Nocardia uniformis]|uniref:helix-turn-helix transcriptional regulator n=1 Tax=Nocardia uniformis TaxID=53432 RepID=UPI0014709651|nr:LuxR C-terminal-related transcriptional regulator [Nocardia uniformis]
MITESSNGHVLLVCSPVGTGKTVLLTQWAARHRSPIRGGAKVVWLTVEEQPHAPGQLWQSLRARLGITSSPRNSLNTPLAEANELADGLARGGERIFLILDDAHLITDPLTLAGVEHFLLHMPPNVTAILSARFELPIRWHLLDMSARLHRWGPADLAFSAVETTQVCREQGCALEDAEVGLLMDLTRGWAALVRIAAISFTARAADPAAVLTSLSRLPSSVSDLLAGELIDTLPPALRLFLTYTSVPIEFTERLADDLVGGGAGHWLYELERLNYPITSVVRDNEIWFSYHPMLRAYFLAELNRLGAESAEELHLRVSLHLQAVGEPAAALPHLLTLPHRRPLLDFLTEHGLALTLGGHGAMLVDSLAATDADLLEDPYLVLLRVVDALYRIDIDGARAHFDAMRWSDHSESFTTPDILHALGAAVACEMAVATGLALEDAHLSDAPPTTELPDLDCYAAIATATALLVRGDVAGGEERLRMGLAIAEIAGDRPLRLRALTRLGIAAGMAGALTIMRQRADHALGFAHDHRLLETPDAAHATALSALGAYMQGEEPDTALVARTLTERTLPDGATGPHGGWHPTVIGTLVTFESATDKTATAERLRHGFARLLETHPVQTTGGGLVPFVVWALLRVNETYSAQLLVEQTRTALGEIPEIIIARAALATNAHKPRAVLDLVGPLLDTPVPSHPVHTVTSWLLYAQAHQELGSTTKAREGMENGLRRAVTERIVRPFLEVPGAVELLDRFAGSFGPCNDFAESVRRHPLVRRQIKHPNLTGTELKVLRQLPSGRTTQQIADDLGISINTVKTHLRGIYTKLGSSSRVGVLSVARDGGLL